MKTDLEIKIINAKYPDEFEKSVNALLIQGCWRITETEMSATDHHYCAILIRSSFNDPATT